MQRIDGDIDVLLVILTEYNGFIALDHRLVFTDRPFEKTSQSFEKRNGFKERTPHNHRPINPEKPFGRTVDHPDAQPLVQGQDTEGTRLDDVLEEKIQPVDLVQGTLLFGDIAQGRKDRSAF